MHTAIQVIFSLMFYGLVALAIGNGLELNKPGADGLLSHAALIHLGLPLLAAGTVKFAQDFHGFLTTPVAVPVAKSDLKTSTSLGLRQLSSELAKDGKWDEIAKIGELERALSGMFK